jgi:hypothetical protein
MAGVWHLRDLQDQEITDILENDNDEVLGGDSNSDEEDQIEERKKYSEESALSSDDEDDIPLSQRIDLLRRRKNYKWHLKDPMQSVRTRRCNILVHLPGTRQPFTNRKVQDEQQEVPVPAPEDQQPKKEQRCELCPRKRTERQKRVVLSAESFYAEIMEIIIVMTALKYYFLLYIS